MVGRAWVLWVLTLPRSTFVWVLFEDGGGVAVVKEGAEATIQSPPHLV